MMSRLLRLAPLLLAALALAACLDPQVSDEPGLPGLILPPGSEVPSAHDDPVIDRQIDQNDGDDDVIARVQGFAAGEGTSYWDFGPAPDFAAPLFILVREGPGGELVPIDHPTIIDAIPGDTGYSPFWAVFALVVTDLYQDELVTSFAAVQEAVQLGLVEPPVLQDQAVNCPVVARGVTLEVGEGEPLAPPSCFYWRGMTVDYYDFGPFALEPRADVPTRPRYVLRRVGGEPLSEVLLSLDITGDGDRNDTNDVFPDRAGEPAYSPLCQTVDVAVDAAIDSIDTFADETMSAIRAATDLFDPDAVEGIVAGYQVTEDLRNCPQQRQPGGL
ncbi:MAG TPA: hypothetical protein VNO33_13570 [Kofleriaceae bacterium]|nr:hypothetical protein [Kofleriaceae bacterium]